MPNLIGYARVSRETQDLQLQLDALEKEGCKKDKIFIDKIPGLSLSVRDWINACRNLNQVTR